MLKAVQQGRQSSFASPYYPFFGFRLAGIPGSSSLADSRVGSFAAPQATASASYSQLISFLLKAEPKEGEKNKLLDSAKGDGVTDDPTSIPGRQPENRFCTNNKHAGPGSLENPKVYFQGFDHLMISHVEWMHRVPYFNILSAQDQLTLMKATWPQIFLVNLAQLFHAGISETTIDNALRTNKGTHSDSPSPIRCPRQIHAELHEKPVGQGDLIADNREKLRANILRIQNLQMDAVEYSCLKAILLFNPDISGLVDPIIIESMQTKIQGALQEYLHFQFPYQHPLRFGRIVLRLLGLQQFSCKEFRENFQHLQSCEQKTIDSILQDIFLTSQHFSHVEDLVKHRQSSPQPSSILEKPEVGKVSTMAPAIHFSLPLSIYDSSDPINTRVLNCGVSTWPSTQTETFSLSSLLKPDWASFSDVPETPIQSRNRRKPFDRQLRTNSVAKAYASSERHGSEIQHLQETIPDFSNIYSKVMQLEADIHQSRTHLDCSYPFIDSQLNKLSGRTGWRTGGIFSPAKQLLPNNLSQKSGLEKTSNVERLYKKFNQAHNPKRQPSPPKLH